MTAIGIDLGTTNSLIAYFDDDKPTLIKNSLGDFLTPSAVSVADDGSILTGTAALDRLLSHPDQSAASFKRLMGTEQLTRLGRRSFRAEELSSFILRALKEDAEAALNANINSAVVSVPAYFNERQRQATITAAKLAGLDVERLVNEPTAAALAHGVSNADEGKYLVFDLGGGTFDVSILDKYDDVMEITATTGDTRLGGNDFSEVLEKLLLTKHKLDKSAVDATSHATIRRQADLLKSLLTRNPSAIYSFHVGKQHWEGELSRSEFEIASATLLQRLRTPTERAVRDSRIEPADFSSIILVGGATRMPMVRSLVSRMFGRLALANVDPDTTVALGAAVQAGLIARKGALRDVVMTDVCPHTLGVALVDDRNAKDIRMIVSPIIERNAIVPISRSMLVSTVADNQAFIEVEAYQGESLRPENNVLLGSVNIDVPRAKKGVETIDVRFTYDVNGVLEVEVTVLSTGVVTKRFLNNQADLSAFDISERFKMLEKLKLQPREQMENAALIARAERLYEEGRDEFREMIKNLITQFESDISSQQLRDADACRKHYTAVLDSLEKSLGGLH